MNLIPVAVAFFVSAGTLVQIILALTARRRLREGLSKDAAIAAALPAGSGPREEVESLMFERSKRLIVAEHRRATPTLWWLRGVTLLLMAPELLFFWAGFGAGEENAERYGFRATIDLALDQWGEPLPPQLQTFSTVAFSCVVLALLLNLAYMPTRLRNRKHISALKRTLADEHRQPFARSSWPAEQHLADERGDDGRDRESVPMTVVGLLGTWVVMLVRRREQ